MGNMLKFECRRLFKKPSFYVCLGLCAVFTILTIVVSRANFNDMLKYYSSSIGDEYSYYSLENMKETFAKNFSPDMLALNNTGISMMSTMLALNNTGISMMSTIMAIFMGIFVCEDRVRGTIKNIYARGYSRTDVFLAKFIVASVTAALIFTAITLVAYISGWIMFATKPFAVEPLKVNGIWLLILGKFVAILGVTALYFMLSELIGTTGFSIAANIFLPSVASMILYIGLELIYFVASKGDNFNYEAVMKIAEYWIYSLASSGFAEEMKVEDYVGHLCASGGYVILFGFLSWLIARKKQVKN